VEDLVDFRPGVIVEAEDVLPDIDAHSYLIGVYQGKIKPTGSRLRAAIACLQFEKPKLQAISVHRDDDLSTRLERGLQASSKVIEGRASQVIEAPKEAEPLDHSGPFAVDNKSRFRRY
jgi:hypothetical protein